MAKTLILLPQTDFDPTEVAVPWAALVEAGHDVVFASETGQAAACDAVTLSGEGLPWAARSMIARPDNAALYERMIASDAFKCPIRWTDAAMADYAAVLFPGGHANGMRPYCESAEVHRIAREAFAGGKIVAAICHGVLPLARATAADGTPLLCGRKTTSLTARMEKLSIFLTKNAMGDHYQTYPLTVEAEARAALGPSGDYQAGPLFPRYATAARRTIGFVVEDGQYISARWPGDAWTLAARLCDKLAAR
ncbi:MAG: type 1 glutamine amidotransferase domain-containing protein [Sphingopyxis sp.]